MKHKVQILIPVFNILHQKVFEAYLDHPARKQTRAPSGSGAGLYGFDAYDNDPSTIKGVLSRDEKVQTFLNTYFKENFKSSHAKRRRFGEPDFASSVIGGKYLYDKRLLAEKSIDTITLTDQYCNLYTTFIGYSDLETFVKAECSDLLTFEQISSQLNLLSKKGTDFLSGTSAKFIGYYYSYRDDLIKKFVLEIGYANGRAIQTGFHYRSNVAQTSSIKEVSVDRSTTYKGKFSTVGKAGYAMTLYGKEGDHKNYMSIMLYRGGMNIQDMSLVRGNLQTMSAHGYIFSAEVFFLRVDESLPINQLLAPAFDTTKSVVSLIPFIKKYLYLQRRTFRIPQSNQQDIKKVLAKKKPLDLLAPMVGTWKIWGLDKLNRVVQSRLEINNDYSATLSVYSSKGKEDQVCLFRVSEDRNGYNLWISAHEADGIELKNIALVEIPSLFSKNPRIAIGASCGVGVRKSRFGLTRLVLIKVSGEDQRNLKPVILEETGLMNAIFSAEKKELHIKAYQMLEKEVKKEGKFKNFVKFKLLQEIYSDARENFGAE